MDGRIVGRLVCMWLNRRFMLVGRWVHNLSGRMKWWVVQSVDGRLRVMMVLMMMFTALVLLMDNLSSWCV